MRVAQIFLGRERKKEGSLKMTSMCAGSCKLDVALFALKDRGGRESRDPSKTVTMKSGKGQRAWETLGSHRGRDDTALTGSSRVTMRQGCASRTQ